MKALVTGAAGLIGAHLVRCLVNRGYEVRALVRGTSPRDSLTDKHLEIVVGDVLNAGHDLDMACADCDVVFHGAARFAYGVDAAALYATAVTGTANMLAACARMGVQRIVVTSSSVVFGHRGTANCINEAAGLVSDNGQPPYVDAKIAQHRRALELGAMLKLDVRLACPTMTLGPTAGRLGQATDLSSHISTIRSAALTAAAATSSPRAMSRSDMCSLLNMAPRVRPICSGRKI